MFEYDIRNPLVHVPLSPTDTCQLFLSITERGQKDHIEYTPEDQLISLNVRYGESCRSKVAGESRLLALSRPSFRRWERVVAVQHLGPDPTQSYIRNLPKC